jgi:hypothetical protein
MLERLFVSTRRNKKLSDLILNGKVVLMAGEKLVEAFQGPGRLAGLFVQ